MLLVLWSPHHKLLIEKLEKVQKMATKLVIAVKTLKYEERLKYLNLPTLKYRRLRRDMIDAYEIFTGKYDTTVTSWLTGKHVESKYNLRNHRFCIHQLPIHLDMREFSFTSRIASMWNSLPDSLVSANTIDTFKIRLDRFWFDQEYSHRKS